MEDTDVDENGEEVFRESDSAFFCRLRDLFANELKTMYQTLESQGCWHGESFINQFDEWQSEFPEELWRVDIERKYIRTYNSSFIDGAGDSQFLKNMAKGRKKYQRRQFERNQEKYMASKFQSSVASEDSSIIRATSISDTSGLVVQPNYKMKLTPYAYMYLNVQYGGASPIQLRARPNVEYEIPYSGTSADIIKIYSSSLLQSFGDLSSCYAGTIDTSKASKIKELIIGNETEGYDNPYLTTLTTGANYLLETLNIENVSGLTQSLNLSVMNNLKELYSHGSNISGVTFADGGDIEIAELPAINAMTMKNLVYLTTLDVTSFDKLTNLTVENCNSVDLLTILNSASNLNRVRIVGVGWTLEDTSLLERLYEMSGIDKSGYNADQSVLTGKVHVSVIRQQQLYEYNEAWSDLEITYDSLILQYPVTFMNYDGTVLEVQYVDEGEYAIDPVTREDNPIATPTKESTVSTDYIYAGWDNTLTSQIFTALTVTATYTESTRSYTIKYVSKGTTLQTSTGLYGENVPYTGNTPTYTLEEGAYKYYLFNRWDKSGFLLEGEDGTDLNTGIKTVTAIFDEFKYVSGAFDGKELADLSPVEIYALTKLTEPIDKELSDYGMTVDDGDSYSFEMGYDIDYDDIESNEIISEKTYFDGTNYVDTGIMLFDEDRDFVLVMDYKILSDNSSDGTLAQCFQTSGSNGFKLGYSSSATNFVWGASSSITPSSVNSREMIVIRHKKGDNNLYVYTSNLDSTDFNTYTMEKTTTTTSDGATFVLGASKLDSGRFTNHCIGYVNWCKIWYKDLGEEVCEKLVGWTHEKITLGVSGFYRYALYDDSTKETMISLVASHLLNKTKTWNDSNTNVGGWAESKLNAFLNTRFYNAIPTQIKSLLKKMSVSSTSGNKSTEVTSSGCYVTIPALYDLDTSQTSYKGEIYNSNNVINIMATNDTRKRAFDDGDYNVYWTRSPNLGYSTYIWSVKADGTLQQITQANANNGVLIEISF